MTGMDTILYFPASSKAAAQEKLAGAKDTAARCGVHVQVVAREPTVGGVRELAAQVEVNVNTVARTFEHLQTQGLIYTKRGLGYFVAADARHKILAHRRDTLLGHELDHLFEQLHAIGVTPDELRQRYHDFCAQKAP